MLRLSYLTLAAKDPDRLVEFYRRVLELAPLPSQGFVYFEFSGLRLAIMERGKLGRFANFDLAECPASVLFSLNVETAVAVDTLIARVEANGGEVVRMAAETSWGRFGIFADPEGHLWEIAWREGTG